MTIFNENVWSTWCCLPQNKQSKPTTNFRVLSITNPRPVQPTIQGSSPSLHPVWQNFVVVIKSPETLSPLEPADGEPLDPGCYWVLGIEILWVGWSRRFRCWDGKASMEVLFECGFGVWYMHACWLNTVAVCLSR